MRNGWAVVLGVLGLACGTREEATSSSASSGGPATSGAGGAGGAGGTGGAPSAATGGSTNVLFPLYAGALWTYEVTQLGAGGDCNEGTFTSKITAGNALDGKTSFQASPWCSSVSEPVLYAAGTGDEVFFHDGTMWHVFLDGTLEDGHTWSSKGLSYKWKKLGSQTLNGQKYGDCWAAQRTDVAQTYDVYCRGIGPIKHHSQIGKDGFDAVLK